MITKGNKVFYKDQAVKFNLTDGYYFINTDRGMLKIEYYPEKDQWYEGQTVNQNCRYREVTPAFVMAYGGEFLKLRDPKEKNLIRSLKILRNLTPDCAHVRYVPETNECSEINDQARVLSNFCQTLSPEVLDFINMHLSELCYVVSAYDSSNFVNEFFLEVLMNIFEDGINSEDYYDEDMFIRDVMDKFEVCIGIETRVRFQDALVDFVRKFEPYKHFGSTGLFIIVSELTEWANDNF